MRRFLTNPFIGKFTVSVFFFFIIDTPFCNSGCVQIIVWLSLPRKFSGERVSTKRVTMVAGLCIPFHIFVF